MEIKTNCYAAVDIGASSGRVVIGEVTPQGTIELTEIHRFDNIQKRSGGHDCWDVDMLFRETVAGLAKCKEAGYAPKTVGIDTWAVDFVLLDAEDNMLGDAVAYRDERTSGMYAVADAIVSPDEVYRRTGIQRQPFNTIYQLLALQREHPEQIENAETFLMIPDYLAFLLTGTKANEYTNASTTCLMNARTQQWDETILEAFDIPRSMFCDVVMPGTDLGAVTAEIEGAIGYPTHIIAPATHDTGSAYLAVPARDADAVFLSSGTWSLLGVENEGPITSDASRFQNFTNEGGFELRFRFLKNIMGLWMIQSIRRELNGVSYVEGKDTHQQTDEDELPPFTHEAIEWGFPDLIAHAKEADSFEAHVNVNDDRFLAPKSMIKEVKAACKDGGKPVPATTGEVMQTIYNSLSHDYQAAIQELQSLTGKEYTSINIVGGGSQDMYLNQMTANATQLPVFAGPTEGTALGNLMVQMIRAGEFKDLADARASIKKSFTILECDPQ